MYRVILSPSRVFVRNKSEGFLAFLSRPVRPTYFNLSLGDQGRVAGSFRESLEIALVAAGDSNVQAGRSLVVVTSHVLQMRAKPAVDHETRISKRKFSVECNRRLALDRYPCLAPDCC